MLKSAAVQVWVDDTWWHHQPTNHRIKAWSSSSASPAVVVVMCSLSVGFRESLFTAGCEEWEDRQFDCFWCLALCCVRDRRPGLALWCHPAWPRPQRLAHFFSFSPVDVVVKAASALFGRSLKKFQVGVPALVWSSLVSPSGSPPGSSTVLKHVDCGVVWMCLWMVVCLCPGCLLVHWRDAVELVCALGWPLPRRVPGGR